MWQLPDVFADLVRNDSLSHVLAKLFIISEILSLLPQTITKASSVTQLIFELILAARERWINGPKVKQRKKR